MYQYTKDDGEPVYVDVETCDEIEMDEVDVNANLLDNVNELEKRMQQLSDNNKKEEGFSDKHPIVNKILFLIFVLVPAIGLILIGRMFFKLLFMK
ncbi:hypothetical protein P4679_22855 [Priestia megaterium]|uniref:hypothetical protein n=1 Tax=Priestia megaterium TaxID=1404 RepID=UPI002E1B6D87|nr:hypothetical protein [Priestia megaterium]